MLREGCPVIEPSELEGQELTGLRRSINKEPTRDKGWSLFHKPEQFLDKILAFPRDYEISESM